jgi:outer membrane biogenesis lipoprotein LolB
MRNMPIPSSLVIAASLLVSACASMRTADTPQIPADAVESTHTESNGDVISEYRVQGQLRIVKVQPARGVTYYMIDSNGDGRMDRSQGDVAPVYYKLYSW